MGEHIGITDRAYRIKLTRLFDKIIICRKEMPNCSICLKLNSEDGDSISISSRSDGFMELPFEKQIEIKLSGKEVFPSQQIDFACEILDKFMKEKSSQITSV